jgi:hypothetical protein
VLGRAVVRPRGSDADSPSRGALMLVSIVVPSYRGVQLAVDTVRSALALTHEDLEVIVVDTSPDDTLSRTEIRRPAPHGRACGGQPRTSRELEPWSGDDDRAAGGAAVPARSAHVGRDRVSAGNRAGQRRQADLLAARMLKAGVNVLAEPSGMLLHGGTVQKVGFDPAWSYTIDMAIWRCGCRCWRRAR